MNNKVITSDNILGKDAVDPDGQILGVVMQLHISKHDKTLLGLTIDQGFMKPDLFIGIDYVKIFGVDSILLSKVPYEKYKGMEVVTVDGQYMGKVKDVKIEDKKLSSIDIFKKGIMRKTYEIPSSKIIKIASKVFVDSSLLDIYQKKNKKKVSGKN